MARIVFGSEFGANLGHIYPLLRLAQELHKNGHEIIFVCRDVETAYDAVKAQGYALVQAPLWKYPPFKNIRKIPTPSYADVLVRQGFGIKQKLRSMLSAWDDCLRLLKPDLIIADHSPGLSLAARKSIPLINVGVGFTLPPTEIDTYPNIITTGKPLFAQEKLLRLINELQEERGHALLERLPQIFEADGAYVYTLPQLDPYIGHRQTPLVGPMEESIHPSLPPQGPHLFLYMANDAEDSETVLHSIKVSKIPATVYIRGADKDRLQKYHSQQLNMLRNPVDFAEILPKVSLVVHSGGAGTASACLMAGKPQILFPRQSETSLTSRLLEKHGLARPLKRGVSSETVTATIIDVLDDQDMLNRCYSAANELAQGDWKNAVTKIVARAEQLLEA